MCGSSVHPMCSSRREASAGNTGFGRTFPTDCKAVATSGVNTSNRGEDLTSPLGFYGVITANTVGGTHPAQCHSSVPRPFGRRSIVVLQVVEGEAHGAGWDVPVVPPPDVPSRRSERPTAVTCLPSVPPIRYGEASEFPAARRGRLSGPQSKEFGRIVGGGLVRLGVCGSTRRISPTTGGRQLDLNELALDVEGLGCDGVQCGLRGSERDESKPARPLCHLIQHDDAIGYRPKGLHNPAELVAVDRRWQAPDEYLGVAFLGGELGRAAAGTGGGRRRLVEVVRRCRGRPGCGRSSVRPSARSGSGDRRFVNGGWGDTPGLRALDIHHLEIHLVLFVHDGIDSRGIGKAHKAKASGLASGAVFHELHRCNGTVLFKVPPERLLRCLPRQTTHKDLALVEVTTPATATSRGVRVEAAFGRRLRGPKRHEGGCAGGGSEEPRTRNGASAGDGKTTNHQSGQPIAVCRGGSDASLVKETALKEEPVHIPLLWWLLLPCRGRFATHHGGDKTRFRWELTGSILQYSMSDYTLTYSRSESAESVFLCRSVMKVISVHCVNYDAMTHYSKKLLYDVEFITFNLVTCQLWTDKSVNLGRCRITLANERTIGFWCYVAAPNCRCSLSPTTKFQNGKL